MVIYVSDAVAFYYYLRDKLPSEATRAFNQAEGGHADIYLPTVAAAELYYLFERKGLVEEWWTRLEEAMATQPPLHYHPFDERVLSLFKQTRAEDIHDKVIVATVKALKADGLITKDEELRRLGEVKTIWDH